jgi:hypothetical protein
MWVTLPIALFAAAIPVATQPDHLQNVCSTNVLDFPLGT